MATLIKHKNKFQEMQQDDWSLTRKLVRSVPISDITNCSPSYRETKRSTWARIRTKELREEIRWNRRPKPATVSNKTFTISVNQYLVEKKFNDLANNWKSETAGYSIVFHKYTNKNYLGIMGMGLSGAPVVPLILKDLKNGPEFWHYALKNITNQNPVPKEHINNLVKIQQAWLDWGTKNNMI